ncbi:MAG: hypothetical protein HZA53_05650 [Planctomycetes bacterium]|nr:hypothetical protein [Planctomycetota bacterium]
MKALDRWRYDPVVRGVLSVGNALAAVLLCSVWFGKSPTFASNVWPLAFTFVLVPLRGDAHQRYWDYARTEWLHTFGFVSRARLATACVVQELVEALLRAGVIVLLTLAIRSTRDGASLYSWLTLGCASWIGMLAVWAGIIGLVRASWSLAVNLDGSRAPLRRGKVTARRNDKLEDFFGPIAWVVLLGWVGLLVALLKRARRELREPGSTAHVRGSVIVRIAVALAIALPPCALGLWLQRAWIPAVCGAGVLGLLWECVREKEFTTSASTEVDDATERESDASSAPIGSRSAVRGHEHSAIGSAATRSGRASDPARAALRSTLASTLLWKQVDRSSVLAIGALLLLVVGLRWSVGGLPVSNEGQLWWVILLIVLLFVPGRVFRWTSTGEQAEFFVAHGRELAWMRRVELTAGLGILVVMAALFLLLVAGAPRTWAEWTCLLVASAQALIACNPSPITPEWRVRDAATAHGVVAGIFLALFLGDASEPGLSRVGFGLAASSFLVAATLWLHGWRRTFDESELRASELRFAERA